MFVSLIVIITLLCLLVPLYVYIGYPLALWILTRNKETVTHKVSDIEPSVTLVISCYNEEDVIKEKIENSLQLNYPKNHFNILVVSDGSEDDTDEIVKGFSGQGVKLLRQEGRLGKTMGLNLALDNIDTEIVVFSDANAIYDREAIRRLVRNFADPEVGYVVGAALYTDGDESASAHNENLYWRYEMAIKSMESRLHSVVGGDGAIYAIRRELWRRLDQRDINDFVNPLQIISQGFRGVFDKEAKCFERTAGDFEKEVSRKERIVNRSIRGLMRVKEVMNPLKNGIFSFEVVSHKLLRWLIPLFGILGVLGSSILTSIGQPLFSVVAWVFALILILAIVAHNYKDKTAMPFFISTPYYFVMVNAYALKGIYKALLGETQVIWNSARSNEVENKREDGDIILYLMVATLFLLALSVIIGRLNS